MTTPPTLYCNYCGKADYEVQRLFTGPAGASVCGECVELMFGIVLQEGKLTVSPLSAMDPEVADFLKEIQYTSGDGLFLATGLDISNGPQSLYDILNALLATASRAASEYNKFLNADSNPAK